MPPVTRRRTRAITVRWGRPDRAARRSGSGNGLDLALRDLLEGDRQGVLGTGLDGRGRGGGGRRGVLERGFDSRPDQRERIVPAAPISPRITRSSSTTACSTSSFV